ncbi:RNA-directed DNA polymerase, eukaryota, reverse transcriptase zinc-binding domain protein, partial [Tanacetum coccineum]
DKNGDESECGCTDEGEMNVQNDGDALLEVNGENDTGSGMGDEMNGEKVMNDESGATPVKNADCDINKSKVSKSEGMRFVVENGPWMVSNKPLVVQRLYINILHVSSWNEFARVLVEVDALKDLPSKLMLHIRIRKMRLNDECPKSTKSKVNNVDMGRAETNHVSGGNKTKRKNDAVTKDSDRNNNKFDVLREYNKNGMNENDALQNDNKNAANEEDDVLFECSGMASSMEDNEVIGIWNVRGMCTFDKQKEVAKFNSEENLQGVESLLVGTRIWPFFVSFVYAANGNIERRNLWADLNRHKQITNRKPWIMRGDMKVILNTNEHFAGVSFNDNLFDKLEELRNEIKSIQSNIDKHPYNKTLRDYEVVILKDYMAAMEDEEKLLFQKSKIKWLSLGDKNNYFFHKTLKGRYQRNKIESVQDVNGNKFEDQDVVVQFVMHFQNFLGQSCNAQEINDYSSLFYNKINDDVALSMVNEVTSKEIKDALFDIGDNKDLGPDGYSFVFFKKAWNVIGDDFCNAVKEFFTSGKMLNELNSTIISLIPKTQSPLNVTHYRPIACCNVVYKCISKVITGRIKKVLGKLVNINQSAFVAEIQIQDNILLTQELLKGYDRKRGPRRVSSKIDIQKAYDTITHVCFADDLLVLCHGDADSVQVVRDSIDEFGACSGPLSIQLKVMLIQFKEEEITHVCFADDLLVLCHGDVDSVQVVRDSIDEFGAFSGLLPDFNKSTIFFGNVSNEVQEEIMKVMPFEKGKLPIKYLGVPLITKRLGIKNCKCLVDKVRNIISNWKNKCLSYAGRLQLVASILESIQVYWCTVFLFLKAILKEIDSLLMRFLWCNGELSRGKEKIA